MPAAAFVKSIGQMASYIGRAPEAGGRARAGVNHLCEGRVWLRERRRRRPRSRPSLQALWQGWAQRPTGHSSGSHEAGGATTCYVSHQRRDSPTPIRLNPAAPPREAPEGFDTYLEVNDEILLMWRKHASSTPRMLFRFEDLDVVVGTGVDGERAVHLKFTTTVGHARENLEAAGFGLACRH